ncbi:MAG: hypothetical protein E7008_00765 [Alphaproteobacteria bacterium]|nr:hypothetical protein [Alphaproteobacteria bacterium]
MVECYCPHAPGLECSQVERTDEFYRQMSESLLANKPVIFLTGGQCPAYSVDCIKLVEYKEQMKKQR